MRSKGILLSLIFIFSNRVHAHTYNTQKLSPDALATFMVQPPSDAAKAIKWIRKNKKLVRSLARTPRPLSSWEHKKAHGNKLLLKHDLENLGSNNFVFKIPDTEWLIKISGPLRRLINIYVHNTNTDPYIPEEYKRHKEFNNKKLLNSFLITPTFVTISRFANKLLCQEVCAYNGIHHVYFPELYLVHIPGNPTEIHDENYIILEREITHLENLYQHPSEEKVLSDQVLKELYCLIRNCALFDFNGENLLIDDQGRLVFIDLEQGIVENPAHFFNNDQEMFDFRVYEGLTSFAQTHLEHYDHAYSFFCDIIKNDSSLRSSLEWPQINKFFLYDNNEEDTAIQSAKNTNYCT